MAFSSFNPATVTDVTLSGGNLTASHDNTSTAGAKTAETKDTGKYYFEITINTITGDASQAGLLLASGSYADMIAQQNCFTVIKAASGRIIANGGNSGFQLGTLADGDVIACAIDFTNEKGWLRKSPSGDWNGTPGDDPATNTGGIDLSGPLIGLATFGPAIAFGGTGTGATEQFTANFGATAFVGTVPSGFTAGWDGAPEPDPTFGSAALLSGL